MNEKKKEDLELLYDMEKNDYMMGQMIKEIDTTIDTLGKEKKIEKHIFTGDYFSKAFFGGIIGGIIGAFWLAILKGFLGFLLGAVLGFIIGAIMGAIVEHNNISTIQGKANARYAKEVEEDKQRVKAELREITFLRNQKNDIIEQKSASRRNLADFYVKIGIDRDYRQLIAVGYMYDFMRLGIATKLEGADGLYYLIRKELRYDQLQATMDEISAKLDTLIDQNSLIYSELKKIDRKCSDIVKNTAEIAFNTAKIASNTTNINSQVQKNNETLEKLAKSSAINNYITERIRREQRYQHYLTNNHVYDD